MDDAYYDSFDDDPESYNVDDVDYDVEETYRERFHHTFFE